ncbi:ribosome biogenesis GTPase Der [Halopseudomonas aestusnigri]|jgi:GTP-binding protein|uniref:ribosome biogenesis GTPase Der n=1 Tax=Halopseudomonas TaxID=2901189 RepID=UPI000C6603BB|nr:MULTISPECIES: ribosome biogenesis GTPase Der [Halopseudomonas]MAD27472.1 ribosome biogenesis GTPase Der [Pseudomonadales bacterium]MEE2798940.1 ribosome biogenesis GTPase Der [Pseudomonadota bacterium]HBT56695.1 ribosome biogenesis GTPase Der [Pseudomonas sp.]MAH01555.1 ribosome biogenesis GTPase Der [Pseudomonadales bacterium]MAK73701.1 ribosome biogenesis GTPase Der [Pseudomonadales bacterium]|tara:strand:- start:145 stop:1566 length:1422 start_codon:yes stop_codon:yes gene_type:complete
MVPVIALVGRPNVGKSTLFNRLTKSRDAIVADVAGLTRDRQYGEAVWQGKPYIVVDTGGITGDEQGLDLMMAGQSLQAIEEADAVLFLVDARAGRTAGDEQIAEHLRKRNKHTYLIANKIDGADPDAILGEFANLGLGQPLGIAAAHGRNINPMLDAVLNDESLQVTGEEGRVVEPIGTKIAIIGRPNVGKSTLVNRMLGEDRVVVFDQAGTTRDSIYIPYERFEKPYTLIDTAGVRRRGKVFEAIEKFSVIKTLQAIQDANVVIFVVDAREGIVEQDLHLLGFVLEAGRALVIAVNKWDGMKQEEKEYVKTELERRLIFAQFADIHFISALHGSGVGLLYKSVDQAYQAAMTKIPTRRMTEILEDAVSEHQPPMVNGRRIKLRYAHLGGSNPPIIVVHGNQVDAVPRSYTRYLENTFRKVLKLTGTPIRVEYKGSDNPYADRKNTLTERQVNKKRRLMSHNKKMKKKSKDKR